MLTDGQGNAMLGIYYAPPPIPDWWSSQGGWWNAHRNRGELNQLPDGFLTPKNNSSRIFDHSPNGDNEYLDESGRTWVLFSDDGNKFHKLDEMKGSGFKTYKFVSKDDKGGSYEAIFVPGQNGDDFFSNGKWLTTGEKQGTYNRVHYEGDLKTWLGHGFRDVVPHFYIGGKKYKDIYRQDIPYGKRRDQLGDFTYEPPLPNDSKPGDGSKKKR